MEAYEHRQRKILIRLLSSPLPRDIDLEELLKFLSKADSLCDYMQECIHAVTKIQAAFRGWYWRKTILWNPHTIIGYKYLCMNAMMYLSER